MRRENATIVFHDQTSDQCNVSDLIKKKRYDTHDMGGRFISPVNLNPLLEEKYFQLRKERYTIVVALLSVENETMAGGMILIPKRNGRNVLTMEKMKSVSCQLLREAFLKSFTIASRMKLIRQSDLPREVRLQRSLSNQIFYFL